MNRDTFYNILLHSNIDDIHSLCFVNHINLEICKTDHFWYQKLAHDNISVIATIHPRTLTGWVNEYKMITKSISNAHDMLTIALTSHRDKMYDSAIRLDLEGAYTKSTDISYLPEIIANWCKGYTDNLVFPRFLHIYIVADNEFEITYSERTRDTTLTRSYNKKVNYNDVMNILIKFSYDKYYFKSTSIYDTTSSFGINHMIANKTCYYHYTM